jgi:hypothetical protein
MHGFTDAVLVFDRGKARMIIAVLIKPTPGEAQTLASANSFWRLLRAEVGAGGRDLGLDLIDAFGVSLKTSGHESCQQ